MAESAGSEVQDKVPERIAEKEITIDEVDISHGEVDESSLPKGRDVELPKTELSECSSVSTLAGPLGKIVNTGEACILEEAGRGELSEINASDIGQAAVSSQIHSEAGSGDLAVAESAESGSNLKPSIGNVEMAEETSEMETGHSKPESLTEKSTETSVDSESTTFNDMKGQVDAGKLEIQELPMEKVDKPSDTEMKNNESQEAADKLPIVTEMKSNEKTQDKPSDSKDDYRQTVQISDSDSEDSDSSSVSSLSSPSSDSDSEDW